MSEAGEHQEAGTRTHALREHRGKQAAHIRPRQPAEAMLQSSAGHTLNKGEVKVVPESSPLTRVAVWFHSFTF